jgi:hypothetical protein
LGVPGWRPRRAHAIVEDVDDDLFDGRTNTIKCAKFRPPGPDRERTLVFGTYAEMPGLSLHLNQAARLFGLREATCDVVLDDLVSEGLLRRSGDGQYRASSGGDF